MAKPQPDGYSPREIGLMADEAAEKARSKALSRGASTGEAARAAEAARLRVRSKTKRWDSASQRLYDGLTTIQGRSEKEG